MDEWTMDEMDEMDLMDGARETPRQGGPFFLCLWGRPYSP
jgi:hypothetical protein